MNLSVSHPLTSRSPFGTCVPPPPAGGVFPGRGALDKEVSFRSNTRCCDKTSPPQSLPLSGEVARRRRDGEVWPAPPAKASPTRGGGIERGEDDGEVVQSSTCVIPLNLKASFVQPLRRLRRQLPWQGSPWQGGFVSDETKWSGCEIIENVTARQSLSCQERWHRAKRRCRRGFVFDKTDLRLLENVTECQSLPY